MLSRHFVSVVENLVENGVRYADLSVEAIHHRGWYFTLYVLRLL